MTIEEMEKKFTELERKLNNQRVNNLATGLPALETGTVNTGDTTTDNIINSLIDRVEKLIQNVQGQ